MVIWVVCICVPLFPVAILEGQGWPQIRLFGLLFRKKPLSKDRSESETHSESLAGRTSLLQLSSSF